MVADWYGQLVAYTLLNGLKRMASVSVLDILTTPPEPQNKISFLTFSLIILGVIALTLTYVGFRKYQAEQKKERLEQTKTNDKMNANE